MVFFALCKVCGSKRLIIESLEPKKVCLFLKQKLMCCRMMMMQKWFLSFWCFHKILCFEGLLPSPVGSCYSAEVHLVPPVAVCCRDCVSEQWMQLHEKKWVHGHKMPGRHISQKHEHWVRISFFERWNTSMSLIPSKLSSRAIDIIIWFRVNMRPMSTGPGYN